jgi:hypothetical protein
MAEMFSVHAVNYDSQELHVTTEVFNHVLYHWELISNFI